MYNFECIGFIQTFSMKKKHHSLYTCQSIFVVASDEGFNVILGVKSVQIGIVGHLCASTHQWQWSLPMLTISTSLFKSSRRVLAVSLLSPFIPSLP